MNEIYPANQTHSEEELTHVKFKHVTQLQVHLARCQVGNKPTILSTQPGTQLCSFQGTNKQANTTFLALLFSPAGNERFGQFVFYANYIFIVCTVGLNMLMPSMINIFLTCKANSRLP